MNRILCALAVSTAFLASFGVSAVQAQPYFNGFETDVAGWTVFANPVFHATRVASGTNGIPSADGAWHATGSTPATDWGGYSSTFPGNVYVTSVDVYLDVNADFANDTRFDFTSAINTPAGSHRRDFAFNAGFYNAADVTGPGAGTNRFVISAGTNTGRANTFPKNPGASPIAIGTTGWYTLRHTFNRTGGNVLGVDLAVVDSVGGVVGAWTISVPSDVIGSTVGGNRYGWFASNELGAGFAFDNSAKTAYVVVDTRGEIIADLNQCVADALTLTSALAASMPGNPYYQYALQYAQLAANAHASAAGVPYAADESDLAAQTLVYKQYRYYQYQYNNYAALYLYYGGVYFGGDPTAARDANICAATFGNMDYNAP